MSKRQNEFTDREAKRLSLREPLINWTLLETFAPKQSKVLKVIEKCAVFKVEHNFKELPSIMMFQEAIDDAFEKTVKHLTSDAKPQDMFSCAISAENLATPIYLRPIRIA